MKKIIFLVLLATSLPTYAFFKCNLDYTAQGVDVRSLVQVEGSGRKKLIVIREASSKEGQSEGVIFAVRYIGVEKTRTGQIVHGETNADGIRLPLSIVLPAVYPGPGQLIMGEDGDSVAEQLTNCRKKL